MKYVDILGNTYVRCSCERIVRFLRFWRGGYLLLFGDLDLIGTPFFVFYGGFVYNLDRRWYKACGNNCLKVVQSLVVVQRCSVVQFSYSLRSGTSLATVSFLVGKVWS